MRRDISFLVIALLQSDRKNKLYFSQVFVPPITGREVIVIAFNL